MIPEPCPSRGAQLHRCSLLQPCQQAAEPQVTPATLLLHTVTSCYLLMAFITKLNTKNQYQRIKISVRPPPSPNFLPLFFFFYPYWKPPFPTACGFCYHGDQFGIAEPECNFQGIPRNLGWCKGSGVTEASRGCHRRTPGVRYPRVSPPGVTAASRGCHRRERRLLPPKQGATATLRGDTGAYRDTGASRDT